MQRTSHESRSVSSSTASVAGRLSAYAAAATGAVFASSSADAAVVITTITTVNASTNFTIDLDISGAGFNFNYTFSNIPGATTFAYGRASATNQFDSNQFVANALVGSAVFLGPANGWNSTTQVVYFPTSGNTAYLGFRLTVGEGGNIYGWIEYVNNGASTTVSRWAYESNLNTGITTPTASAVPGGAGLAALACGAAGLRGRRRSRN